MDVGRFVWRSNLRQVIVQSAVRRHVPADDCTPVVCRLACRPTKLLKYLAIFGMKKNQSKRSTSCSGACAGQCFTVYAPWSVLLHRSTQELGRPLICRSLYRLRIFHSIALSWMPWINDANVTNECAYFYNVLQMPFHVELSKCIRIACFVRIWDCNQWRHVTDAANLRTPSSSLIPFLPTGL